MKFEISKSYLHDCSKNKKNSFSASELKNVFLGLLKKNGVNEEVLENANDGVIQLNNLPESKVHTMMLEAEQLGLSIKYTKKTQIEVS